MMGEALSYHCQDFQIVFDQCRLGKLQTCYICPMISLSSAACLSCLGLISSLTSRQGRIAKTVEVKKA